jgi:hypothetical protein
MRSGEPFSAVAPTALPDYRTRRDILWRAYAAAAALVDHAGCALAAHERHAKNKKRRGFRSSPALVRAISNPSIIMREPRSRMSDGVVTMPEYRAYILGINGERFIWVADFSSDHPDDATAMKAAKKLVDGHDVELWDRGRLVARFDGEHGDLINIFPTSIVPRQADMRKLIDESREQA